MHVRSILAIARKDALDILLNKTTFYFLLSPLVLAILFSVINLLIAGRVASASVLIYNPGNSGVEQFVSNVFEHPQIKHASSPEEVANALGPAGTHKNTSYFLGLVVPPDFDSSLRAGRHPQVKLYINNDDLDVTGQHLLEHALSDYARSLTSPQSPIGISTSSINPLAVSNGVRDLAEKYAMTGLLYSLVIGTAFVPGLLVEEKEKKTIRMLMTSRTSWGDVVASKLLVALGYQVLISALVLLIQGALLFGQVHLLLPFTLLCCCFGLALGLLFGSLMQTNGTVGIFVWVIGLMYSLPPLVLGPLSNLLQDSPLEQVLRVLPTYYMADGMLRTMQGQGLQDILLDVGIVLGSTIVLAMAALWVARRHQSAFSTWSS